MVTAPVPKAVTTESSKRSLPPPVARDLSDTFIKDSDIDWTVYERPPDNNEYAVVHNLPNGSQRVVARVSGHLIALTTGVHFWYSSPLPPRIPQDLSILEARYAKEDIILRYARPTQEFPFVVLGEKPVLLYFPRVLTAAECSHMIDRASTSLSRSLVTPHKGGASKSVSEVRTSQQAWLDDSSTPMISQVAAKLLRIVGIDRSEPTQILRYQFGQQYLAHHDFFDPLIYGHQTMNRAVTFFMYLNDVPPFGGGDTFFPRAFGKPQTNQYSNCSAGLRIFPRQGAGAVFYDQVPTGQTDAHSLHGSCPITADDVVKWGGTKWFRTNTAKFGATPNAHAYV